MANHPLSSKWPKGLAGMSQLHTGDQQTVQTVFSPVSIQRVAGSGATHPAALMGMRAEWGHGAHRAGSHREKQLGK